LPFLKADYEKIGSERGKFTALLVLSDADIVRRSCDGHAMSGLFIESAQRCTKQPFEQDVLSRKYFALEYLCGQIGIHV